MKCQLILNSKVTTNFFLSIFLFRLRFFILPISIEKPPFNLILRKYILRWCIYCGTKMFPKAFYNVSVALIQKGNSASSRCFISRVYFSLHHVLGIFYDQWEENFEWFRWVGSIFVTVVSTNQEAVCFSFFFFLLLARSSLRVIRPSSE